MAAQKRGCCKTLPAALLLLVLVALAPGTPAQPCDVDGQGSAALLTAIYGYSRCIGSPQPNDLADLRSRNCTVIPTEDGRELTNVAGSQGLSFLCRTPVQYMDGLVVTFNAAAVTSTLQPEDFNVTLSDGSVVSPICVVLQPANEVDENHTVLLLGTFGDGQNATVNPTKVEIVGDLCLTPTGETQSVNANGLQLADTPGMDYMFGGLVLAAARLEPYTNLTANDCGATFSGSNVTHRVQLWLSGGATIDGVQSLLPNDTGVFEIRLSNGSTLAAPAVVGLADLGQGPWDPAVARADYVGDGDNYIDVCLQISGATAAQIVEVHMPCTPGTVGDLRPPKGFPSCTAGFLPLSLATTDSPSSNRAIGLALGCAAWATMLFAVLQQATLK